MRTPAGQECPYYYEDFARGRSIQECRLVEGNPKSAPWRPKDCARCPVPDILRANASPDLHLTLTIKPVLLGFVRQMQVEARCDRHNIPIENRMWAARCAPRKTRRCACSRMRWTER